ncbi:MAG: GyrI-like domain-containing protein [Dehalococcoidia bacterium]
MGYEIKFKDVEEQKIASIRVKTTLNKVPEKTRQLVEEATEYLTSQNVEPIGPPLAIYYEVGSFVVDFEVGFPVNVDMEGNERVKPNTVPGGPIAYTVFEGKHIDIPDAHRTVHNWLHDNAVETSGDPAREVFLTDPRESGDEFWLKAESVWPIKPDQALSRADRRRRAKEQQKSPSSA